MKNLIYAFLPVGLALFAAGCSGAETAPALPAEAASSQAVSYTPASHVDSEQKDKVETVYVDANADGSPSKVTVEAVLKNPGGLAPIADTSTLQNIKNTEGDESFTQSGTSLEWQNHGEDIHYKGTTKAELPVSVQIEYLLDGVPTKPQEMIGKSGHVALRFTYQNQETRAIQKSGRNYTVKVPFTAISLVGLPSDTFYNVTVDHGKAMDFGGNTLVFGYALPGLSDSLQLADYEPTEEVEIPESVEISCDTSDFSLEFTATIFSPGLLGDADLSDLDDADSFIADMEDLKDGVNDLADATRELSDGTQELYDGTKEYVDGVNEVNDAVQTLMDGLRDAAKSDSDLRKGADALSSGWLAVLAQLLNAPDLSYENCAERLPEALCTYTSKAYEDQVQAAMQTFVSGMLAWPQSAEDETLVDIPQEIQAVFGGVATLPANLRNELSLSLLNDSLTPCYRQRILANAALQLADSESPSENEQAQALTSALAAWVSNRYTLALFPEQGDAAQLEPTLTETESAAYASLTASIANTLAQSLLPLLTGTGQLSQTLGDAFNGLADTVGKLKEGTQALSDAGTDLQDGVSQLNDGTGELADSVQDFQKDSVPSLTDLAGEPLRALLDRVRAVQQADLGYQNFSGLAEGQTGSVSFLFETEELKKD